MTKTIFDNTVSNVDSKIEATKTVNTSHENLLKRLKKLYLGYFIGKNYFEEDGTQNYLVFQPLSRYFKHIANIFYILSWRSKGLSDETIKPPATSDNSLNPLIDCVDDKIRLKLNGSWLKQRKISYTHRNVVNVYIVYELGASSSHKNDRTLKNCLFGAVTLTENADIDKYGYSGYGIGFDRRSSFSFPGGEFGQNILIFGVDMSSSAHIDNKQKDILFLRKSPTQGLEHTAEKMYSINCTVKKKKFCLSLHYNAGNSYLFMNGTEIYKLKAKDSKIVATPLCLRNISNDWSVDNMKKTGFTSYVYNFSVDYDAIAFDNIKDIHKYLMKKNNFVCM